MKGFYGDFGGQFVAETLIPALDELENKFNAIKDDEAFREKVNYYLETYVGRPTPIYYAEKLSQKYGFNLYLKREDLLHTGAHKINNTIGQALLTKFIGKKRVIAETGAGQHGVATATAAALFDLDCTVYMGEVDAERQSVNVRRMKMLGANVNVVSNGTKTLKDAISAAMKDWVTNILDTHYIVGSVVGAHPFPMIVAYFQSVIGNESYAYFKNRCKMPDYVVACVGGGSNAMGIFKGFEHEPNVGLIGVEAGGRSNKAGDHAMPLNYGRKGIFQGALSYVVQDVNNRISDVHSISAGLDYAGVGPEHSFLRDSNRAEYVYAYDEDVMTGFFELTKLEGILPALESSHALGYLIKNSKRFEGKDVLLNLSGRGDKDLGIVFDYINEKGDI